MKRKIIEINEDLCNGCGQCITNCAEAALILVDGKARLVADVYCDGLGACLGECPTGALKLIEREAPDFDEAAVHQRIKEMEQGHQAQPPKPFSGCPSARFQTFSPCEQASLPRQNTGSALGHWPVQIHLVPPHAPFLRGADLLVAADCVPVACAGFHTELLPSKAVMVGCPKFDNAEAYVQKFKDIFTSSGVRSVTVASMEVPCCSGLPAIVERAMALAGSGIPLHLVIVSTRGQILQRT